jgi:hypothetical protein
LPASAKDEHGFVPEGWKLITAKSADLNGDGRADLATLIRMTDPANVKPVTGSPYYHSDDTNPYLLVIAFAEGDGYALASSHDALFPREVAPMHGDDPPGENSIELDRGILTVNLGHLRGFESLRFGWNSNAFALIGYDCSGTSGGGEFSKISANYLTRTATYERGRIDDDRRSISTVKIIPDNRSTLERMEAIPGWTGTDQSGNPISC